MQQLELLFLCNELSEVKSVGAQLIIEDCFFFLLWIPSIRLSLGNSNILNKLHSWSLTVFSH